MPAALPSGTVTFLFTDIEGSTQLLLRLGETYRLCREPARARKLTDSGADYPLEVGKSDAHGLRVRANWEDYRLVFGQAPVYIHWEIVEIAERRHGADLAVWKRSRKLRLAGQAEVFRAHSSFRPGEIHYIGGGQRQKHHSVIGKDHDHFSYHFARDMLAFCNLLSGVASLVLLHLERDVLAVQVFLESLLAVHYAPPLAMVSGETGHKRIIDQQVHPVYISLSCHLHLTTRSQDHGALVTIRSLPIHCLSSLPLSDFTS
jgi:hypothetical protein